MRDQNDGIIVTPKCYSYFFIKNLHEYAAARNAKKQP